MYDFIPFEASFTIKCSIRGIFIETLPRNLVKLKISFFRKAEQIESEENEVVFCRLSKPYERACLDCNRKRMNANKEEYPTFASSSCS